MSYCKNLNIADIEQLTQEEISKQLDVCEQQCNRYTQCDTVAYMNDILTYSENCPLYNLMYDKSRSNPNE